MIKKILIGTVIVGFGIFWWEGFYPHLQECIKARQEMAKREGQ